MDLNKFFLYTASLATAGVIVAVVSFFMMKTGVLQVWEKLRSNSQSEDKDALLQLRLQAHERLIVFVDRINPANLLLRLHQQGIEVGALQLMAVNEIKLEYQHNISQQLYLSTVNWEVIRKLKDDTIAMVNNAAKLLPADASGLDLSRQVLHYMSEIEENPYELTIGLIKRDIHQLF